MILCGFLIRTVIAVAANFTRLANHVELPAKLPLYGGLAVVILAALW